MELLSRSTVRLAAGVAACAALSAAAQRPRPAARSAADPQLLFHVTFDGAEGAEAVAALSKGEAGPVEARDVEWTDGVRGRAARLTRAAGSVLAYAHPGNVATERGTVSLWARAEWPDEPGGAAYRVLFSHPRVASGRPGSHALMLWWHGQALRGDVSDDRDSWQSSVPAGALDGRWHHYAFAWDPNGMAVHVDGRRVGMGDDSASPMKAALRAADNGGALYRFSRPAAFDRFYVGSRDDGSQWDGAIDEIRIYDAPLSPEQIAKLAAEFGPPPEPAKPDYRALYATAWERGLPAREDSAGRMPALPGGLPPSPRRNPFVGALAATPGVIPDDDLELLDEIRLGSAEDIERLRVARRLRSVGELGFGAADGVPYARLGSKRGSRIAIRFSPPDDGSAFFVFDVDVPDDALRTMDCIVQKAKGAAESGGDYAMQCGVAAGGEYPNTGRVLTHRVVWWRSPGDAALVLSTARDGAPGAVAAVRLWRVKSGTLPQTAPPSADGTSAPFERRHVAMHYEDPALGYGFAVPGGLATPASMGETIDRAVATMRFAGEDMLFYPGAWYHGLIDEAYTPRPHAPDFLSGWYEKFDAEGDLGLVPTLNVNDMPVPPGLVTMDSMTNGALHSSPVAIHDTGLPNWGKWHGTPPNFNIAHPEVRRWLAGIVDRLVAQGAAHPSFKGVCLHVTRHGLLTWGGIESGYNDYAIDAFSKATGIRVPADRSDPLRGKAYADWLRAHPDAMEAWLDWRCDVVAGFWGAVARRMRERRPDLRLWVNCYTTSYIGQDYAAEPGFLARANRELGVDPARIEAAAPNIVLAQGIVPADWRWRGGWIDKSKRELQRSLGARAEDFALPAAAAFPWVAIHDRYWESSAGRGGDGGESLSCDWLSECAWRVSTINPVGAGALREFALPLRFTDVLGFSKGGFLVGTYGIEPQLARFARAFRSLPAVRMEEFFRDGAVVARRARVGGRVWGYVVNTGDAPAEADVPVPAGAVDAVTLRPLSGRISLAPCELVPFFGDGVP